MEFIINVECVICGLLVIGGVVSIFAGGNKRSAQRPKLTRYRDKGGTDHSFFKIINYVKSHLLYFIF